MAEAPNSEIQLADRVRRVRNLQRVTLLSQIPDTVLLTLLTIMDTENKQPLFLPSSDDEREQSPSRATSPEASAYSSDGPGMFFADSDDDDPPQPSEPEKIEEDVIEEVIAMDVDIKPIESRAPSIPLEPSKLVGTSRAASSRPSPAPPTDGPPNKKRKVASDTETDSNYLGSFLVGNAWSTVKGRGYITSGDEIKVVRDGRPSAPAKAETSSKSKAKDAKSKGGKKQLSIATMLKPQTAKPIKKLENTVVRLTDKSGSGASERWTQVSIQYFIFQ